MSKKLLSITVRGTCCTWDFQFYGDPANIRYWREDGLDVCEVVNVIPEWVVRLGITRLWCAAQDIFNFKNPWRKQ